MTKLTMAQALFWFFMPIAILILLFGSKLTTIFYALYFILYCKKPTVICKMTKRNRDILENVPGIYSRFYPFILTISGLFQSFADRLRWKRVFPDKTIVVKLNDGGEIVLDIYDPSFIYKKNETKIKKIDKKLNRESKFIENEIFLKEEFAKHINLENTNMHECLSGESNEFSESEVEEESSIIDTILEEITSNPSNENCDCESILKDTKKSKHNENKKKMPIKGQKKNERENDSIILVHGFNSSSDSNYIRILAHHLKDCGFRVFALNSRGTKINLKTPIFYHVGWTDDIKYVLDYVLDNFNGKVSLIGFSLGGNWVIKFLGEERFLKNKRYTERVTGGMAVSTPFDFKKIQEHFSNKIGKYIIDPFMANKYKKFLIRNSKILLEANVDLDQLKNVNSVKEIDETLLKKIFDISDLSKHYVESSCIAYIPSIKKPLMIINSKDDPIVPLPTIDIDLCKDNENVILILTEKGGHLGFVDHNTDKTFLEVIAIDYINYIHKKI